MADTIVVVGLEAGDDYSTITSAFAAMPTDVVATGGNYIFKIRAGLATQHLYNTTTTVTDDTHRVKFVAFDGDEVNGKGEGAAIVGNSTLGALRITGTLYVTLENIKVETLAASGGGVNGNQYYEAYNCFFKSVSGSGFGAGNSASKEIILDNVIAITESGSHAISYGNAVNDTFRRHNRVTAIGGTVSAFDVTNTDGNTLRENTFTNCVAFNGVTSWKAGTDPYNGDYNASDDGNAALSSLTTSFISRVITDDLEDPNGVAPDYNLKLTSTLKGVGDGGSDVGATLPASAPPAGITATVSESGPSFTESVSTTLTASLTGAITETGPGFTEVVNATLTKAGISGTVTESGPSFTESISATVTPALNIVASITETGPSFTESITADLSANITSVITEQGPSFTENISVTLNTSITSNITEYGPSFAANISAGIPIKVAFNPKNVIRVKRKSNTVKIANKTNIKRIT